MDALKKCSDECIDKTSRNWMRGEECDECSDWNEK